ncbi:hypothetical protein KCP73_00680 [Salmonella enterica subsp. enterica]|nr:hypothetical protein KCP73_00680 [Salmonella enterica subsp. enterica]
MLTVAPASALCDQPQYSGGCSIPFECYCRTASSGGQKRAAQPIAVIGLQIDNPAKPGEKISGAVSSNVRKSFVIHPIAD